MYLLFAAVLVLAIVVFAEGLALINLQNAMKLPQNGTAAISANVTSSPYMVVYGTLSINGKRANASAPISLRPKFYQIPKSALPINSSSANSSAVGFDQDSQSVQFFGLVPHSKYTLTLNGSASPYCFPGLACALFIVKVYQVYNVTTGPNGSATQITIQAYGIQNQSASPAHNQNSTMDISELVSYPECNFQSVELPLNINAQYYVECAPGQRMLNFLISSVNRNGTITEYTYPPFPILPANATAYKQTVKAGEAAGYTCSGYFAYLNSTDYSSQTATFRVVKGPAMPCPA